MWEREYTRDVPADPEVLWRLLADVDGWGAWNPGIASIHLDGPLAVGARFRMTPPGEPTLTSTVVALEPGRVLTDLTELDGVEVRVEHRLDPGPDATRVTYRITVSGPGLPDGAAAEIGSAVSADFPEVLDGLAAHAAPVVTRFAPGPAVSPGYLLWCVTLDWQRAVTAALRPLGVTHVQFVVLACAWWLHEQGRGASQVELARHAAIDVKMTSQVVRALEGKGLLARDADPADARVRRLRPTDAGAALARRAVAVVEDVDQEFFGDSADAAVSLLQRLRAAEPG